MKSYPPIRWGAEVLLAVFAGTAALVVTAQSDGAGRDHGSEFLPFMAPTVEGIGPFSLLVLFLVGLVFGVFGRAPAILLGFSTVVACPIWSVLDMAMGGDHNLFPIEWFFYGVFGLIATAGAVGGRLVVHGRRRK